MKVPYKNNRTLLLENNSTLGCTMKVNATLPKIKYQAMMEKCGLIYEYPYDTCDGVFCKL